MIRRTFLQSFLGLLGIATAAPAKDKSFWQGDLPGHALATPPAEESHHFDWTQDPPFTTDPRYAGKLTRGYHNVVICDGKEFKQGGKRFQTGPEGWIEYDLLDEKGMPVQECYNLATGEGYPIAPGRQWLVTGEGLRFVEKRIYGHVCHIDTEGRA